MAFWQSVDIWISTLAGSSLDQRHGGSEAPTLYLDLVYHIGFHKGVWYLIWSVYSLINWSCAV
jgi:hypothetical protein